VARCSPGAAVTPAPRADNRAPHGLDGVGRQLAPQPADEDLDRVAVAIEVLRVQVLGELAARDHRPRAVHQVGEQAELMARQRHGLAVHAHAATARVERQPTVLQQWRRQALRAPDQRAHAGQQFLHVERLGQVVVGPGIDAGDLFVPAVARGEDEHRHRAACLAPLPQHREAIEQRQSRVEHHGVVGLGQAQVQRVAAIAGLVDRVAGLGQAGTQRRAQRRFVLDEQQPHGEDDGRSAFRRRTWSTCAVAASTSSLSNWPPGCSSLSS
jgi:NAD(P)H-hydrate repair Nnr-like enzyme with NAD(P)H-hydrate epimerase domain